MPHNARRDISPPLQLLRRLRDVMALARPAQERLDILTKVVADEFECDVCSIYLLRAGEMLELYASHGLNPHAVHLTRLNVGEGLVGEVALNANPLNLSDAPTDPRFAYRPETDEDRLCSFAGVPILSGGKVVGVLVVQREAPEFFNSDQMEVLQTIAMVLAEVHASGQLISLDELRKGSSVALTSQHLTGTRLAPGLVRGPAVLHRAHIEVRQVMAENIGEEEQRLENAIRALQETLEALVKDQGDVLDERAEIMETYRMFTRDQGWLSQLSRAVQSGLTAEAAVQKVQEELHARIASVSSEYIRERIQDLENLSVRLLQILAGKDGVDATGLPARFVLVARKIGPAELLEYGRKRVRGLILEEGSATSHIAIIARSMGIPVVGAVENATRIIRTGDPVIVDGDRGEVYVRPYDDVTRAISEDIRHRRQQEAAYETLRELPAESMDGTRISLNLNIGLFVDSRPLQEEGVDGIGLYRTELPYMVSHSLPDVASQMKIYRKVIRQAGSKRVIFRTFDIGGDKQLPYFPIAHEENPAMGWRATRIGLDRPTILRRQLRALLRSAAGQRLDVMFPFISEVSELEAARHILDHEREKLEKAGEAIPSEIRVGVMIEIPSLLWQLSSLLPRVDFVSVGSNDLLQFFYASDRGNPTLVDRFDELSPAFLIALREVARKSAEYGVEVGFCGDMARKPLEAMALIGLGFRSLSMPPSAIGPVKAMVRSINVELLTEYVDDQLGHITHSLRSGMIAFAKDHGIAV